MNATLLTPPSVQAAACDAAEHPALRRMPAPPADAAALERAAGMFRAAGDVARLRVLALLLEDERCVSELAQVLGAGMSTVSQQLRLLREEQLVAGRREGKHIYYRLADGHIREIIRSVLEHAGHCDRAPVHGSSRPEGVPHVR